MSTCQGDKHLLSKELAIPYRDLRLLDPEVQLTCMLAQPFHLAIHTLTTTLGENRSPSAKHKCNIGADTAACCNSYPLLQIPEAHPSAILVREKALVIHLESIRMVITQDAVYILTVPSAMDRQVGVLPTSDAPLVKDLMLRLSMASEASDKSLATRSDVITCHTCEVVVAHSSNCHNLLCVSALFAGQPHLSHVLKTLPACTVTESTQQGCL